MTTVTKTRVGGGDLLWVAWRTHRTSILVTSGLVALAAVGMAVVSRYFVAWASSLNYPTYRVLEQFSSIGLLFALAAGMFWGAPLVAREYELRTHLLAWGQDVSASRWLAGQVALLGAVTACLAALAGVVSGVMLERVPKMGVDTIRVFERNVFEAAPQVQVGCALFAFALGVAVGALTRRTLPAMAITGIGFLGVGEVLARWGREHYLPPVRSFEAWSPVHHPLVPFTALPVDSGYADANGVPMGDQDWGCGGRNGIEPVECLRAHGAAGRYADYQPAERVELFRWIESGIFLVLAAGLLLLAWYWLRRARRV
ncbi:hypothetical protein [Umezawaea tangerina]|uniref:ABC-2 family transporter n=1 Tax=Umezawaea tangerina TaxID=84725 RepID=A0A2T0TDW7_9PSEU|nr:hypothetical protein [Umezawaea tangerina]PRY43818.1 hypothetical protein CLV43_103567 [Umezawaea tangerina]